MASISKRGRIWYATYHDGKRWRTRSTRCTSKRAALAVAAQLEREAADPAGAAQARATVAEACCWRLQRDRDRYAAGDISAATLGQYIHLSGRVAAGLGADTLLRDVDADAVAEWLKRRRLEVSQHTCSKERGYLRQVLRLGYAEGWFGTEPSRVLGTDWRKGYEPRRRWLTFAEADALLLQLQPHRAAHVAFVLGSGARYAASMRARYADITDSNIHVRGSKTATSDRVVPVLDWSRKYAAMAKWWLSQNLRFRAWHSGSRTRDLQAACARAGIESVSFNDLRRTAGWWLYTRTGSADTTALYLGHRGVGMVMQVYGRLEGDELGAAIKRRTG